MGNSETTMTMEAAPQVDQGSAGGLSLKGGWGRKHDLCGQEL